MELFKKLKERFNLYVRSKCNEFLEEELKKYMYLERWEIEWFAEKFKLKTKLASMNQNSLIHRLYIRY